MSDTTITITIPLDTAGVILTDRQAGELHGLLRGIRQVGAGNEDVATLCGRIREVLDLGSLHMIGTMLQSGFEAAGARSATSPPAKQRGGMPLGERIDALPLDVAQDIRGRFGEDLRRYTPHEIVTCILDTMRFDGERMTVAHLARLLGVPRCEIYRARKGVIRPTLKARMAEVLGWDGGAA